MKLTPIEIKKQEFKKSMRGYDAVEVDTFIELVANEYENLLAENETLRKQILAAETELKHFKEVEKTLKQTLYNVQETSQMSKENSQKEATLIKKEAELAAAQMTEKARLEVHKMHEEVIALKQQKESFIARLRHLLSSQIELLDVLSVDDEDIANLKDRTRKSFTAQHSQKKAMVVDMSANKEKISKQDTQADAFKKNQESGKEKTQPRQNDESHKKRGPDFFRDIFNDNLDVDDLK